MNNFLKLLLLIGLFLVAREASANCMWDTHSSCKDIGTTWADAGSGHDSYCDGTFKDPNYTNHCCCGSDIVGCCKKNLSGKITTENLLGQACKSLTGYYSTTFYQDKAAENNQCVDKAGSGGCTWKSKMTKIGSGGGTVVTSSTGGCSDTEHQANNSLNEGCSGNQPADESQFGPLSGETTNTSYICCCPTLAATTATMPKFVIPELQIKIPGLNFSSNNCTDNGDKTYACSIPWIGEYINAVYNYGLSVAGILAAIILMAGGLLWLISGGDASKITQAKELIGGSIIGIIILMSSYIILKQINPALLQSVSTSFNTIGRTDLDITAGSETSEISLSKSSSAFFKCAFEQYGSNANESYNNSVTTNFLGAQFRINKKMLPTMINVQKQIDAAGITYKILPGSGSGSLNWRANVNNPDKLSLHSFGIAIDINPGNNPNYRSKVRPCKTDIPQNLINILKNNGFRWGGEYRTVCDSMHFEWLGKDAPCQGSY